MFLDVYFYDWNNQRCVIGACFLFLSQYLNKSHKRRGSAGHLNQKSLAVWTNSKSCKRFPITAWASLILGWWNILHRSVLHVLFVKVSVQFWLWNFFLLLYIFYRHNWACGLIVIALEVSSVQLCSQKAWKTLNTSLHATRKASPAFTLLYIPLSLKSSFYC